MRLRCYSLCSCNFYSFLSCSFSRQNNISRIRSRLRFPRSQYSPPLFSGTIADKIRRVPPLGTENMLRSTLVCRKRSRSSPPCFAVFLSRQYNVGSQPHNTISYIDRHAEQLRVLPMPGFIPDSFRRSGGSIRSGPHYAVRHPSTEYHARHSMDTGMPGYNPFNGQNLSKTLLVYAGACLDVAASRQPF